jgi:hypothetical protein
MQSTDYVLPPHNWVPSFSGRSRRRTASIFPGGGGTVYYCDSPDSTNAPVIGQIAFYGLTNYLANTNAYLGNVFIDTPITSDRYGNIFFGFQVTGSTPLNLTSGVARIDYSGTGTWISASTAASDPNIVKVAQNCAPALGNDHKTLYVAVNNSNPDADFYNYGYLLALDSRTLAPLASVVSASRMCWYPRMTPACPMTARHHPPSARMATCITACWRVRRARTIIAAGSCISTARSRKPRFRARSAGTIPPPSSRRPWCPRIMAARRIC